LSWGSVPRTMVTSHSLSIWNALLGMAAPGAKQTSGKTPVLVSAVSGPC
jgi:hypothetical protein